MVRHTLTNSLRDAILQAQESGEISFTTLPDIQVERPQDPAHGDFASGVALRLSRSVRMNPLQLAHIIVKRLPAIEAVESVSVAAPGFINFTLRRQWLAGLVRTILDTPEDYGCINIGNGETVQIEFVSANPTGPLHVGHGRGAVLGSTLANVMQAAGYRVSREYYLNDMGNQIRTFARSLYARYLQALGDEVEMPADGYMGDYVVDLARSIVETHGARFRELGDEEGAAEIGALGTTTLTETIRQNLRQLNVTFDVWFSEKSLHESGEYDRVIALLRDSGYVAERDNAVWFDSSALGDDKDNVLVRGDGSPTYFASDVAYH